MSPDKTPAEIAVERDERGLYLSDPDLYGALVRTEDEAVHLTAEMAHRPQLTLRVLADMCAAPFEEPPLDGAAFASLPWKAHAVTGTIAARFSDPLLCEVFEADAEALTLRTVVERLGYDVTEEIDAILGANPTGPWSLADLETMFGSRDLADDKTAADCRQKFPHQVRFAEWVGPDFDDGDENTRL